MNKNFSRQSGITLLELIIATAIISVISMISTSAYTGYIETAKVSQAVSQIKTLSFLIDDYADENGQHPESLDDIGNQNLKDPWGNPYVYFNLTSTSRNDNEHGGDNDNGHDSDNDHDSGHDNDHDNDHDSGHDNDNDHRDDHGNDSSDNEHGGGSDVNIGGARKDRNLTPINTKYDLCSMGRDGKSKPPLRAADSQDDIIYANDGGYIGLASEF